jgi:hypothetical protein
MATELVGVVESFSNEDKLKKAASQSLRTRITGFQATGSWPTGTHPFGYGKACYSPDGTLLWTWQPIDRARGQEYSAGADGTLKPAGPADARIRRKERGQVIKLVPSNDPDKVRAVELVFDLFARQGLSRRQISARLNAEGLTINGGPFACTDVVNILSNPAYVGDTHFGKRQSGELHTFDGKGMIEEVKGKPRGKRAPAECLVRRDTHEALIDRRTWDRAQERIEAERDRTTYAPRNPNYYLRRLFVCGHCGKPMAARTDGGRVIYVCSSYIAGRVNGHPSACGYHSICHDEAEKMLLDKVAELSLPFDPMVGDAGNVQARLDRVANADDEQGKQWQQWIAEGVGAFSEYLQAEYGVTYPRLPRLLKRALEHYCGDAGDVPLSLGKTGLADLRTEIAAAERAAVGKARKLLAELTEDHAKFTKAWVRASEMMQPTIRAEIDRLQGEIAVWHPARWR